MATSQHIEPLRELFSRSKWLTLDFSKIPVDAPPEENIRTFFEQTEANGHNPRSAAQRQVFNDALLAKSGARYLVSRYGEDRSAMLADSSIADEQRTLHLGVDVFCRDTEPVYSPCDGEIVMAGNEPEDHSFGYYVVIKPSDATYFIFLGHLSAKPIKHGYVRRGQQIAQLGDHTNGENGGWSRHLHIQLFSRLPDPKDLIGYATPDNFQQAEQDYPNPMSIFPDWRPD